MPIQLNVWERRDSADRDALGNAALAVCRAAHATDGIHSSRFYWAGTETIVILTEGDAAVLNAPNSTFSADWLRAGFAFADLARNTTSLQLIEPRTGQETYRRAGR